MKGYDFYTIDFDIYDFLEYIHLHQITIYRLNKKQEYSFYSNYKYRKLLKENPHIHYKYSTGIIGMFFRFNIDKMIALFLSCIFLFGLSNTIFDVQIIGDSIKHKEMIQTELNDFKIPFFFNEKGILQQLIKLNDHLNWYELIHKGSKIEIHYLPRFKEEISVNHTYDLIAEKEGVIASFDVSKGNKVVSLNQKVNKGDLLVSQITIDSQMNEKTSEVIGSVYAYTFYKVDIEIVNKYPIGLGYYVCILRSRMQFDLEDDEKIVKEISLHFSEDLDTIRMSNYYVLYEKISIVGE